MSADTADEACEQCGFVWAAVSPDLVPGRLSEAAAWVRAMLTVDVDHRARPEPQRWSSLEYTCHLRDVAFNLRDRMILALVEDRPHPPSMFPAHRVDAGLYQDDTVGTARADLHCAAGFFERFAQSLTEPSWQRELIYPWPRLADRSLAWVAAQVVHEFEHHGADVESNTLGALDRVHHLALVHEWEQDREQDVLTRSTRGRTLDQAGFIHLCTGAQLDWVIDRFYDDVRDDLLVLTIDPRALPRRQLRLDRVGEQVFPHLTTGLPRAAVLSAEPFRHHERGGADG